MTGMTENPVVSHYNTTERVEFFFRVEKNINNEVVMTFRFPRNLPRINLPLVSSEEGDENDVFLSFCSIVSGSLRFVLCLKFIFC